MNEILPIVISTGLSALTLAYTYWHNKAQQQQVEKKIFEDVSVELIKQRIEPYSALMSELIAFSSLSTKDLSPHELRETVKKVTAVLQLNIFGKVGLIATHEAREIILRLRSKCLGFLGGDIPYGQVHEAAMQVHQILRSDLALSQPGLSNSIEKLRKGEIAGKKEQIETIVNGMNHIKW